MHAIAWTIDLCTTKYKSEIYVAYSDISQNFIAAEEGLITIFIIINKCIQYICSLESL